MIFIENFIKELAEIKSTDTFNNHYSYDNEENELRRDNLKLYLEVMSYYYPDTLLVGEAPGYKGCSITGVPFTSERIVLEYLQSMVPFLEGYEFKVVNKKKPSSEASATIIWNTLKDLNWYPLFWNAFPFHPHEKGNKKSNRKPNGIEKILGQKYLKELVDHFRIENIIAIGRVSQATIKELYGLSNYIRHPSNGGKKDFQEGIKKFIKGDNYGRNN